jgi:tight adherence protein C
MPKRPSITSLLSLEPPPLSPDILAAIFSSACASGLTAEQAIGVMAEVADIMDPHLAYEIHDTHRRLSLSTNRDKTYARLIETRESDLIVRLLTMLRTAEKSGEEIIVRSRKLFEAMSQERENRVAQRVETYPLIMVVVVVLFFLPALVILLAAPVYISVLEILRSF